MATAKDHKKSDSSIDARTCKECGKVSYLECAFNCIDCCFPLFELTLHLNTHAAALKQHRYGYHSPQKKNGLSQYLKYGKLWWEINLNIAPAALTFASLCFHRSLHMEATSLCTYVCTPGRSPSAAPSAPSPSHSPGRCRTTCASTQASAPFSASTAR